MSSQDSSQPFQWRYDQLEDKNFQVHGRSLILIIILFAIILLFTILCFYARCVCRYRHQQTSSIATATALQQRPVSTGLDLGIINKLPIVLHRSPTPTTTTTTAGGDEEVGQCSICLTTFEEEEKVKVLPGCNHSYHPECVDIWLTTHSNCPLCRASLLFQSENP